jgi:hypothetical protein
MDDLALAGFHVRIINPIAGSNLRESLSYNNSLNKIIIKVKRTKMIYYIDSKATSGSRISI